MNNCRNDSLAWKALRGHSPATRHSNVGGLPRHITVTLCSASSGSERSLSSSLYGFDLTLHVCEELPRYGPQRTISASILTLKSLKAQNDTLCPRNPVPRSNLTDEQKQQQLFLNRRAALYNPARPESSGSLVNTSDYTTKSHRRRHLADDMEVSEPESLRNLKLKACRNDKLVLLKATEPELLSTLVEIDRDKKALREHSPATVPTRHAPNASGLPWHRVSAISGSSRSVSCSLYGHDLTLHRCGGLPRPEPKRTISAGTRTLKPFKTQTLCLRNPLPESRLKDEQKTAATLPQLLRCAVQFCTSKIQQLSRH